MIRTQLRICTALWLLLSTTTAFVRTCRPTSRAVPAPLTMIFGGGGSTAIPKTTAERDRQAIAAVQAAVSKPKTPGYKLIECEFPPLAALNKLGDGSLQSAQAVDAANLAFAISVARSLSVPLIGPTATLLTSTAASSRLVQNAKKAYASVHTLSKGLPDLVTKSSIFVLVAPSSPRDYQTADDLAQEGATVVLVNGFAKTPKSVGGQATMAYYLKPLTYNSQIAGWLLRTWPRPWTTLAGNNKVLQTADDADTLVPATNTPDLRGSVKAVQRYVDQQAMAAREKAGR